MAGFNQLLDDTLIALADPTRRAILWRLAKRKARITELAAPFPISLNSVSKHIKILERARLIERIKVRRDHFPTFRPQSLELVQKWIAEQESFWRTRLGALDELSQYAQGKKL